MGREVTDTVNYGAPTFSGNTITLNSSVEESTRPVFRGFCGSGRTA